MGPAPGAAMRASGRRTAVPAVPPPAPRGPGAPASDYMAACAVLALVLLAVFWPTLLLGQPVASADGLRGLDAIYASVPTPDQSLPAPWERLASAMRHPLVAGAIYDPAFHWIDIPNDLLQAEYFRRGQWPLWNPYVGLGTPLLATGQSAAFFPLKLIVYLFPPLEAYSVYLIARLLLAGCFTYAFARAISLGHWPALLAGTAYMLNGFVVTHFHNVDSTPPALLPLVLWSIESLARRQDARAIAVAGLSIGLLGGAGHPEPALFCAAAAVVYYVARTWALRPMPDRAGRARIVAWAGRQAPLLASVALGAAVVAVTVLPFVERLQLSASVLLHRGQATDWATAAHVVFVPLALHALTPLAVPEAQYNVYVGPLAVALAAVALRYAPAGLPIRALATMAAASLALFFVSRGSELVPLLPIGLNAFYNVPPLAFAMALLSAAGVEALARLARQHGGRAAAQSALIPVGAVLAIAVALWDLSHDAMRRPGLLAAVPLVLVMAWAGVRAARLFDRHVPVQHRLAGMSGRAEAWLAGAGAALLIGAGGASLGAAAYGEWIGQAMSGTSTAAGGDSQVVWTGRGWQHRGVWRINRTGADAVLHLPPRDAGTLEWWGTERVLPLDHLLLDKRTSAIEFTAGPDMFRGELRGGFHRFLGPAAAGAALAELLAAGGLLLALCAWRGGRFLPAGVFAVTALSLITLTAARNPPLPRFDFPETPVLAHLRAGLGDGLNERVAQLGHDVLIPNTNVAHRLRATGLQDPLQLCRYQQVFAIANRPGQPPGCGGQHQTVLERMDTRILAMLGASHVVAGGQLGAAPAGSDVLRSVENAVAEGRAVATYEAGGVHVYRISGQAGQVGRAIVTGAAHVFAAGDPEAIAAVADPGFDPANAVVVEAGTAAGYQIPRTWPPGPSCDPSEPAMRDALRAAGLMPPAGGAASAGEARVVAENGSHVRVRVSAPSGGFLVLLDSHAPGWQAFVDGERAPLCRANLAFRAVPLAAGDHEVVFRYAPLSFAAGLAITMAALAAAGLLLARSPGRPVSPSRVPATGDSRTTRRLDPLCVCGWVVLVSMVAVLLGFAAGVPLP